jgi:hypothetical protein
MNEIYDLFTYTKVFGISTPPPPPQARAYSIDIRSVDSQTKHEEGQEDSRVPLMIK